MKLSVIEVLVKETSVPYDEIICNSEIQKVHLNKIEVVQKGFIKNEWNMKKKF